MTLQKLLPLVIPSVLGKGAPFSMMTFPMDAYRQLRNTLEELNDDTASEIQPQKTPWASHWLFVDKPTVATTLDLTRLLRPSQKCDSDQSAIPDLFKGELNDGKPNCERKRTYLPIFLCIDWSTKRKPTMSESTIPPDIAKSAGPLLLGYMFNWGLFGALSVQVYMYYMSFPKDRLYMKCLVYGLYLLEVAQTGIVTHDAFDGYAKGFGNLKALHSIHLEWLCVPIFSGIVSGTVQIFFAYRIYYLSRSKAIGIAICVIALTEATAAIIGGVQAATVDLQRLQSAAFASTTIWLAGSAVCDIIIAGCMSYFLSKKDTAFKATRTVINKLIRLTIETGTLTATVATIDIVLFLAFRHNNYHTAPATILAKLYSNTLLMICNSRMRIVGGRDPTHSTSELMDMPLDATSGIEFNKFTRSVDLIPPTQRPKPFTIHTDTWAENDDTDQRHKASSSYLAEVTPDGRDTKVNLQSALGSSSHDTENA
ncbi:hypothetical protein JR316_0006086 [Psilocybe cubensis]|uniref:Uncharacterized protein n=2 Tax=Psilocybe cubensis TaxID=181762 RepID=A0ACB8H1I6_PSICU|nr:hypothetical protein JR316_0006086 [Psilocybe cubensis]KAH9481559.1 hypothetical protein JR316_0006086 [Psilocybe cubensis]